MSDSQPLSTRRMSLGLVCGSIVGLICFIFLEAGSDALSQFIASHFFGFAWRDLHFLETISIFALFGTPIAIIMGLLIGLPIWIYAENLPLRSKRSAAIYGAASGGCIGIIFLLLGLAIGLSTFLDDKSSYNSWTYGYQVTRDGLPTALGWALQFKTLLFFICAGGVAGLAARFVAIPR